MKKAIVALGTNLNNRLENLKSALAALNNLPKTKLIKISGVYETKPFQVPDKQENYYNCCLMLETDLMPHTLLGAFLGIESALGRKRSYKNAARIIDIDLIFYQNESVSTNDLILPHPRAHERAFVLVPVLELIKCDEFPREEIKKRLSKLDISDVTLLEDVSLKGLLSSSGDEN